jgi:hypothetical protein
MHTRTKQSNEIGRRLHRRHTEKPTIKSAGANQQVEDATSKCGPRLHCVHNPGIMVPVNYYFQCEHYGGELQVDQHSSLLKKAPQPLPMVAPQNRHYELAATYKRAESTEIPWPPALCVRGLRLRSAGDAV